MYVLTEPVYPRRQVEKWFKQLYNIGLVLNFGAFVITVTSFAVRLDATYEDFFGNDDLKLTQSLQQVLQGCNSTPIEFSFNHITTRSSLNLDSANFVFLMTTNLILGILIIHACLIAVDFFAKLCFTLNVRHIRVRGLHFPLSAFLTLCAIALSACVITLAGGSTSTRAFVQDYVEICENRYQVLNAESYVNSENDSEVVFGTNFVLIIVATSINLFAYVCAAFVYMSDAARSETATLVKEQFPWEKGFFCRPNKPVLKAWSRWRREQEQAVKENAEREVNPALAAIAAAAEEEEIEREEMLQRQLAANELSRERKRLPPVVKGGRRGYPSDQLRSPRGSRGAHRGGRDVPPPQWDNEYEQEGDEFVGEDEEFGDEVAADYVYESGRGQRRRKHRGDDEGRRRRRRRKHRDDADQEAPGTGSSRGGYDNARRAEHAAVPMDPPDEA